MTSPLFQQFLNLLQEVDFHEGYQDCTTYEILADDLYTYVQSDLKLFVKKFDHIMTLFTQLLHNYQNEGTTLSVCSSIFEIFVIMVERRPTLIKKFPNRLLNIIQRLFEMFNMVDFQFDQAWMKPHQGYVDQQDFSEESTLTKQIMSFFDRIAMVYTCSKFIEFFNGVLPGWFNTSQDDWKSKYTLIMVMSQLGEDIEYPLLIKNYVDCGILSIQHPHPKVRYATLQMIGQLSDDMKPDFQFTYGEQILPLIISASKDPVPRVQAHAMACLTNFLQDFQIENYYIIEPYVNQIISIGQNFIQNGISIQKENTMSSLALLATIELLNQEQIQKILNVINYTLTSENHQQPEYNQLINQTIQGLSMVLNGQNKNKVQKYLNQSVIIMKSLKQRISASYFVNAWSRLCLKYQNFTDLSDILPYILLQVTSMIESYESELEFSIRAISNTIKSFKQNVQPFTNDIINFCKNGIAKLEVDSKQKSLVYDILNDLVINLKSEAPDPQWNEMSRSIFTFFYEEVQRIFNQQEQDIDIASMKPILQGLQENIKYIDNLFTSQSLNIFAQKMLFLSEKISQIINSTNSQLNGYKQQQQEAKDQLDKEELAELEVVEEQNIKILYEARLTIPDIFASVFEVVPVESMYAITQGLYPHISQYLMNTQPLPDIRYGLYFLCNFQDKLKYEGIQQYANVYEQKFCQYTLNHNLEVRNCAVYGLGVFMKIIPVEKTNQQMIYKWLNILWNSLSLSVEQNMKQKQFNFARDNIVSALGKLIYAKRTYYPTALNIDVHKKWFENLPLNNDKVEGNEQHQILLNLLQQSPEVFIGTKQDVLAVLTIFAKYFSKRKSKTQETIVKNRKMTCEYFSKMKDWPIFQSNFNFLWSSLPENHKTILTKMMDQN